MKQTHKKETKTQPNKKIFSRLQGVMLALSLLKAYLKL